MTSDAASTEVPNYARAVAAQMNHLASKPIRAVVFESYRPDDNYQDAAAAIDAYVQTDGKESPWIRENVAWAFNDDWPEPKMTSARIVMMGAVEGVAYSLSSYGGSQPVGRTGFTARSLRVGDVYYAFESVRAEQAGVTSTEIIYIAKHHPARGDWLDVDRLMLQVAKRIRLADQIHVSKTSDVDPERVTIETVQEGIDARFVYDEDFILREATSNNPQGHEFRLWTFGKVSVGNTMLPKVLLRLQELPNGGLFMRLAKIEPAANEVVPTKADPLVEVGPGTMVQDGRVDQRTVAGLDARAWQEAFGDRRRVGLLEYVEAVTNARLNRERSNAQ
ncbi:MAG: hypothetical protein Kow00105_16710 [Phycisphaeraceae bacterium]